MKQLNIANVSKNFKMLKVSNNNFLLMRMHSNVVKSVVQTA
jgi:hypothetical protein